MHTDQYNFVMSDSNIMNSPDLTRFNHNSEILKVTMIILCINWDKFVASINESLLQSYNFCTVQ